MMVMVMMGRFSHELQWAENCKGEVWSIGGILLLMVFGRLAVRYIII